MELQHLRAFYEVAKRGSISAGAKAMRITQPSITRTVQNLEASLDQKLFIRQARGVTLTEEGQRVYERCHRIFQECEAIEGRARVVGRRLRVAASENLCIHVLPKILAKDIGLSSADSLELVSGTAEEVIRAVLTGEADAGYCYHPSKMPGLSSTAVASVEFWIVASAKLVGQKPSMAKLRELALIASITKDYAGPYAAKSLLSEAGLNGIEVSRQCNSQEAQLAMTEAGLGFSLVPWFIAKDKVRNGALKKITAGKALKSPLYRVTRIGTSLPEGEKLDAALKAALETRN